MLSAGLPENHGLVGGWVRGWLGWRVALSSMGGGGSVGRWRQKTENQKGRAIPLGPPIQYSLALMKRAQRWGGVDVDYKGGGSCRMVDVGGLSGRKGNSVGARFRFCSSRRLRRRRRRPHPLGLAFSSHLWRPLLLGAGGKQELGGAPGGARCTTECDRAAVRITMSRCKSVCPTEDSLFLHSTSSYVQRSPAKWGFFAVYLELKIYWILFYKSTGFSKNSNHKVDGIRGRRTPAAAWDQPKNTLLVRYLI